MRKYLKFNYVLGVIVLLFGLSNLLGPIEPLSLLGMIYYIVAAIALFKKPKVGYILLAVAILGLILAYTINYYVNSY